MAAVSLVALLALSVVQLFIPGFFSTPSLTPGGTALLRAYAFATRSLFFFLVLFLFIFPLVWVRSRVGYLSAIILGFLGVVGETMVVVSNAGAGALSLGLFFVVIPAAIFSGLLIVGSVLAWGTWPSGVNEKLDL